MTNQQLYAKTLKEQAYSTALLLGCPEGNLEQVWLKMAEFALPLTAKSFVYQVANAMEMLDIKVNSSTIHFAAERL